MYKHRVLVKPCWVFYQHLPEKGKRGIRRFKYFYFIPVIIIRAVLVLKALIARFIFYPVQAATTSFRAYIKVQFSLHGVKKKNSMITVRFDSYKQEKISDTFCYMQSTALMQKIDMLRGIGQYGSHI